MSILNIEPTGFQTLEHRFNGPSFLIGRKGFLGFAEGHEDLRFGLPGLIHDYKGTSFHGIYLHGWIFLSYQTRIFAGEPISWQELMALYAKCILRENFTVTIDILVFYITFASKRCLILIFSKNPLW